MDKVITSPLYTIPLSLTGERDVSFRRYGVWCFISVIIWEGEQQIYISFLTPPVIWVLRSVNYHKQPNEFFTNDRTKSLQTTEKASKESRGRFSWSYSGVWYLYALLLVSFTFHLIWKMIRRTDPMIPGREGFFQTLPYPSHTRKRIRCDALTRIRKVSTFAYSF